MGATYDSYYREYYKNNRERILANSEEYRVKYSREYYRKNKEAISAKRKAARLAARKAKQALKPQSED